jgi:hypothetical protein
VLLLHGCESEQEAAAHLPTTQIGEFGVGMAQEFEGPFGEVRVHWGENQWHRLVRLHADISYIGSFTQDANVVLVTRSGRHLPYDERWHRGLPRMVRRGITHLNGTDFFSFTTELPRGELESVAVIWSGIRHEFPLPR